MAFCPHCGKQVTDQASKCIACGKEIEPKAKGARFKGTMMMQPPTAAAVASPAAANPTPAAPPPEPAKPAIAAAPAAQVAPAPASSKAMKATMLGTGGAGLAPPFGLKPMGAPAAAAAARTTGGAPVAPAPAANTGAAWNAPAKPPAAVAPAAPVAPTPEPAIAHQAAPEQEIAHAALPEAPLHPPSAREDSKRFQRSDMNDRRSPYESHGRESTEGVVPVLPTGRLLAFGVGGMLVIAVIGYVAARMLGLIN